MKLFLSDMGQHECCNNISILIRAVATIFIKKNYKKDVRVVIISLISAPIKSVIPGFSLDFQHSPKDTL